MKKDISFEGLGLDELKDIALSTIRELETETGILASGKDEIYGCIFGRDSLITGLKLLKVYEKTGDEYFLFIVRKIIRNLIDLQGTKFNIESGEEPGKCIHEYRPENHLHLTGDPKEPWFLYPDGAMRNYDSVDSTFLLLITTHRYITLSGDKGFYDEVSYGIQAALTWLIERADSDGDGLIDYHFSDKRKYGGLRTQSWMDSVESVFHEDGAKAVYPIAPVEVQAYGYLSLKLWSDFFEQTDPELSLTLHTQADTLKKVFNVRYPVISSRGLSLAFAIDGAGKRLVSARSSMAHCLWAAYKKSEGGYESIIDDEFVPAIVLRLMQEDLFNPFAGLRTLSTDSKAYDASSYHNGSIWPHDTSIAIEGLENFGFHKEAATIRQALLSAYSFFKTPVELFTYSDSFRDYESEKGQKACKKQAWSAAALLSEVV